MGDNWKRLGEEIIRRRVELGYATRDSFARESRLSSRLLSDLENGRRTSYDPSTLARLERALRWVYGSAQAIVDGAAPTPLPDEPITVGVRSGISEEMELMALLVRARLPQESLERVMAYIEMRRADQHLELLAEVKRLIEREKGASGAPNELDLTAELPDGTRADPHADVTPDDGGSPYSHLAN